MITIIYQFKHNVTWHCRINQFFAFPEQLQIWIYVFLVGDHRYEKDTIKNIREAKKQYFDRIFTAYQSDMKKTWRTINETLNRNKKMENCLQIYFMMV